MFRDDVVNEQVAVAASRAPASSGPRNVLLSGGRFESVRHEAQGRAQAIDLERGGRVLTLTNFEVDNGPDLRVYLVAGPATSEGEVDDFEDLGGLKGNKGNQQYDISAEVDRRGGLAVAVGPDQLDRLQVAAHPLDGDLEAFIEAFLLVFALAEPLEIAQDEELVFVMLHRSTLGDANIGRFRVSVTDQPGPAVRSLDPMPLEQLAAANLADPAEIDKELRGRLLEQFLSDHPAYQEAKAHYDRAARQLAEVTGVTGATAGGRFFE
jgi:hypothetical protein